MAVVAAHSFVADGITVNMPEHFRSKLHMANKNTGKNLVMNIKYFGFTDDDFNKSALCIVEVEEKTTPDLERSFTLVNVYKQEGSQPDYYMSIDRKGNIPILNSHLTVNFTPTHK
ncbi:MAG: hypothetical protein WCO55_05750 [Candidatus Falkowbacteria bacterium]